MRGLNHNTQRGTICDPAVVKKVNAYNNSVTDPELSEHWNKLKKKIKADDQIRRDENFYTLKTPIFSQIIVSI